MELTKKRDGNGNNSGKTGLNRHDEYGMKWRGETELKEIKGWMKEWTDEDEKKRRKRRKTTEKNRRKIL